MAYGYCGTEAKFVGWLQSALRSVWSKHPAKLALLEKKRVRMVMGTAKKMIWHVQCEHCKKLVKMKDIECNHKNTVGGLSKLEDRHKFLDNLLLVHEQDLELLCHECHGIVTYMERYGVSKREAIIEKKCIAFYKETDKVQIHKCQLAKIDPVPKTKIGRKNAVREYLRKNLPQ